MPNFTPPELRDEKNLCDALFEAAYFLHRLALDGPEDFELADIRFQADAAAAALRAYGVTATWLSAEDDDGREETEQG